MKISGSLLKPLLATSLCALSLAFASAQHPVAPSLSSNPGAQYTIFLNFSGFDYSGTWAGGTPGNVPAYTQDGDATTFTTDEVNAIKETWARVSQAYIGFNINVTTVDPAPSNLNDAQRKDYYDNTQYLTHTIIGGSYNWYGAAGGVSYVGVAQDPTTVNGMRTNWVFPANGTGTTPKYMTAAIIHEDGHHLRLWHQSDENNGGGYSSNNGAVGDGSYAPIMGVSYYSQRGTWRVGKAGVNDNDVAELQKNTNIGPLLDSGIGHSMATATALAIATDGTVDSSLASGWIMPTAESGYSATSYTTDFFKFYSDGGPLSLTAHDGTQFLQEGVADPGATMRSVLEILDINGTVVGTATEDASTLNHIWNGTLGTGEYYARVRSYGAYVSSYEPDSQYFNMGAYFLSGSGFSAVPEPATMVALLGGVGLLLKRRRKSA
ncbi:MAG TPA: PEP-CTERM sorting domain-containing protein [Fimbriimonas sp.]|nr:PEP-CTERM sorting domain-containing protein [Fimbriimonas sp.]